MFRFSGFTQKANSAINIAMKQAMELGHTYIGSEHLILGMLDENSGKAYELLTKNNINFEDYKKSIIKTVGQGEKTSLTPEDVTPRSKKVLEMSIVKARMLGQSYVGTEHLLMVLVNENDSYGVKLLKEKGVDIVSMKRDIMDDDRNFQMNQAFEKKRNSSYPKKATPNIDKYCIDLTEQASINKLDPVIGRELEIKQVIEIICRRIKNNPCLVGEAGVGKTAIIEGIAQLIINKKVPTKMIDKRIMSVDISSMVAGSKYRGDFEDKFKNVINEAQADDSILLFIDEIHTIVGAGAADGALDAASILKPYLSRGTLQIIGTTTYEEYRKIIEKNTALERRFQKVVIDIPNQEHSITMLQGIKNKYEEFHGVIIKEDAVEAAVYLSERYIPDRNLPDKAIDLIDTAAARLQIQYSNEANQVDGKVSLTKNHIVAVVSDWTGIDITELTSEQTESLINLENILHNRVVGQHEAISSVASAIRRGRVGLKDPNRPIGSFMFLGSTGVGKTELCLALSEALFGNKNAIIRVDMSEYMEKHSVSKLIGSPAGYVGYEDGGQLTEKVRQKPYSVVLFDEVEKAHPDVLNILLQVLEDGTLKDSHGVNVSFKNTVVVMTSNVGADHFKEKVSIGFNSTHFNTMKSDVMDDVKKLFRPEFINRVDDIVVFHELPQSDIKEIAVKMLDGLSIKALNVGINLEFTKKAIDRIVTSGYSKEYGARPLRRVIQKDIEDLLANQILKGNIQSGDSVLCDYKNGFKFNQKKVALVNIA